MTPEQFTELLDRIDQKIDSNVKESVGFYVNGKIDRMNQKLDDYIVDDNEWKKIAQPAIDSIRNAKAGTKFIVSAVGFIAGLVAIWQVIKLYITLNIK